MRPRFLNISSAICSATDFLESKLRPPETVLVLATAAVLSVRGGLLVRDLDRKHLGVRVATLSCKRVLSALLELGFEVVLDAIGTAVHVRSVMMLNRLLLHRSGVLV